MEIKKLQIKCKGSTTAKLEEILDYQGNLKDLTKDNFEKLLTSLKKGFTQPISVWIKPDGTKHCMDGHQRCRVLNSMKKDGWIIPDLPICEIFADTEKEAAEIVLRNISAYGNITMDGLIEFQQTYELDIEEIKNNFRFPEIHLENYEPDVENKENDDDVPSVPKETVIKTGDLIELGNHRVICGDCTDRTLIDQLMNGNKADFVFTDPPYGVSYAAKNKFLNSIARGNRIQEEIINDQKNEQEIMVFWKQVFEVIRDNLNPEYNSYYITGPQIQGMMMMVMMMEAGLPYRHVIIWVKNNHVLGRCDYNYKHEPLFFGWTTRHKFYGNGSMKTSVWEVDKPHKSDLHPTMKPVELIVNAILNSSQIGMNVLDVFGGSGSTLIASEKTERKCFMSEIDEHYCDVIIQRYCDYTKNYNIKINGIETVWKSGV